MDQHNIDRLFREKMDGLEVTPSTNSWTQVEKKLKPNRKPAYYWVAAAVTLIAISWILIPNQRNFEGQIAGVSITNPPAEPTIEFKIPVAATLNERREPKPQAIHNVQVASNEKLSPEPAETKEAPSLIEPDATEVIVADAAEILPILEDVVLEPLDQKEELETRSTVKITYIASNTSHVVSEVDSAPDSSTSKFKKIIAFAEKIDPGEMLADMKTAKDNLLNGGFKSKKDKSVMNP